MKSREEIIDYIKSGKINTLRQNIFLSFVLEFVLAGAFAIGYLFDKNKATLITGLCSSAGIFLLICLITLVKRKEKIFASFLQFSLIGLLSSIGYIIASLMLLFDAGVKSILIPVIFSAIWCVLVLVFLLTEKKRFEHKEYKNANIISRQSLTASAISTGVGLCLFRVLKHFMSEEVKLIIIAVFLLLLSYLVLFSCTAFIRVRLIKEYSVKTEEIATDLLKEKPLECLENKKRLLISLFAGFLFYFMYCTMAFVMHSAINLWQFITTLVMIFIGIPVISVFISSFKMNNLKNSALSMFIMYAVAITVFWIIRALLVKNADGSTLSNALINTDLNIRAVINIVVSIPALAVFAHLHNKKEFKTMHCPNCNRIIAQERTVCPFCKAQVSLKENTSGESEPQHSKQS